MKPRLLDDDPITGIREWFVPSVDGETFTIVSEQNVGPLYELNAELRKDTDAHTRWGEGMHVAHIPPITVADLMRRGIWQDPDRFARWINSDESLPCRARYFRKV